MNRSLHIALITLGCVAAYVTLRSLPVEKCEFLHYGDYINSEGVIEGCGYEETEFFNMEEIRFPVISTIKALGEPVIGQALLLSLELRTTTGRPIVWEDIAVSHTERIHAMVVDPSLEDYQHVHPQPAGAPGFYTVEVIPRRRGDYKVYLDLIPLTTSRRTLLEASFNVPGEPGSVAMDHPGTYRDENLEFAFTPIDTPNLTTGKELRFRLSVVCLDGAPTRFEPVMDSYAHVVAFDADRTGFAHLHPLNPFVEGQDPTAPELDFGLRFDKPGHYRVWAQVIVNGRHVFAPFDLSIL